MGGPFSELPPGTVLGGFTIIRTLGRGGMATVYLAQHPRLPRQYALKVLSPHLGHDPSLRARFEREAHLASRLDHPNVVAVHDRGLDSGLMWLVMQYVDGSDASVLLESYPDGLPPQYALSIVSQAAAGLDAAHRQGMLHRDVKPANLLLTADGRVLVSDFGIARALDDAVNLTDTGMMVATIAYAAPEVIAGQDADPRSDVYALGCTLYELLTGSKVFPRASRVAVMDAHMQATPTPPTQLRPGLVRQIDAVIAKALSKDPNDRYQTCQELAAAATMAFQHEPTQVMPVATAQQRPMQQRPTQRPTSTPRPARPPRRIGRWAALIAVAALAAASIAAGAWVLWPRDESTISGRWIGSVVGDTSGRIVAHVSDVDGRLSAAVDYPDVGCAGSWQEIKAEGGVHTLNESISAGDCPDSEITVRQDSDGTLRITSTYFAASQNQNVTVTATLSRNIDLGLDIPIAVPACDGMGIVMLGASITPGAYADEIAAFLEKNPGASYLRTDAACPSLRQATDTGNPIYAVYRNAGHTVDEVCAAVRSAGGDAYGTWLDRESDPTQHISCPAG